MWTNTTACAWRGDTKSRNYGEFSGPWCIEGSGQSVTASIRMMDSARGYHSGGGNAGSGSCTTKWDK